MEADQSVEEGGYYLSPQFKANHYSQHQFLTPKLIPSRDPSFSENLQERLKKVLLSQNRNAILTDPSVANSPNRVLQKNHSTHLIYSKKPLVPLHGSRSLHQDNLEYIDRYLDSLNAWLGEQEPMKEDDSSS